MSGFGERFRREGYKVPKPLIMSEGKPFVQHVVEMFDPNDDFIFICNKDHLNTIEFEMEKTLKSICPKGRIYGIEPHKKGPVFAVKQILEHVDLEQEIIVNYCDFTCYWNYSEFLSYVKDTNSTGSIPAYRGFHPHSLGKTNYAYIKEENLVCSDIKEKEPFTEDKANEFASSGTYYFNSGNILSEAIDYVIENDININGEYYISLCYKYLFDNKFKTTVFPLQHFMQWGTPQDFEEYNYWSEIFKNTTKSTKVDIKGHLIIPMAGDGQRFKNEGYQVTKPLIEVSGEPMVFQALKTVPNFNSYKFIIKKNLDNKKYFEEKLNKKFNNTEFINLENKTDGQATTINFGVNQISDNQSISVISCDNGYLINQNLLKAIITEDIDVISWCISDYPYSKKSPNSFGWVYFDENKNIQDVSVKELIDSTFDAAVITGGFTFKSKEVFEKCYKNLKENKNLINGEYYADSLIKEAIDLGMKCSVFLVDKYISWGTPNELKTFEYWQSCFHKWDSHPYIIENDETIPLDKKNNLVDKCTEFDIYEV